MICPSCLGDRVLPVFAVSGEQLGEIPCPSCEGYGVIHCCEGEQCQPEAASEDDDK